MQCLVYVSDPPSRLVAKQHFLAFYDVRCCAMGIVPFIQAKKGLTLTLYCFYSSVFCSLLIESQSETPFA